MRKYLLAAAAVTAIASPAAARDGQPYVGIEGGVLFPRDQNGDAFVDYTTVQTPATPAAPAGPADADFNNAFGVDYKRGRDLDIIAGYDFGMFRLEGEIAWKRTSFDELEIDNGFVTSLNTALNRPSALPDPGAPGLAALTATNLDLDGRVKVRSIMANALVDFGDEDALSFYAGAGIGRARLSFAGDSDNSMALQFLAGLRYALSPNIDAGLKYRYFRTGKVGVGEDNAFTLAGNPNRLAIGTPAVTVDQTTSAVVDTNFEQRFRSHSLLASLIFNFGAPPAPPPIVEAPPPPPPPAPPATQTCPDGSVILATDACPVPPPPPPPAPAPAGERG